MKRDIKLYDAKSFEALLVETFGWEHGIGIATYCEDCISFYWDYRTENEIRNNYYDMQVSWSEIAEQLSYDHCEWCENECCDDIFLCWND